MSTTRSWRDVDTTYRNASGIVCDRVPTSFLWESMTLLFYCGYLNHALRYFNVSNNQPVHLTVLYESLCPASLEFVVEHLYPAHEKHGMYFHTELVPYGLAYMNQNGTIKCQHGERECAVDRFQSCVIKNMDNHLPYIYCLSKALLEDENWLVASSSCFDELNVTSSVIQEIRQCNSSNEWEDLARAAFVRKETFFPEKAQHIPWVLFNNVSLKSQQYRRTNLSQSVCSFYVGDNEPASCDGF
ncbi:Protein F37H8.5 [Aphelenchoides avenae]|nr:Protein F37H8.5 [Aphelenchus avenae]